jgi:hypothetical protein
VNSKTALSGVLLVLALLWPADAPGQVHAQLGPAAILDTDVRLGVYGLAGDDQVGGIADARFLLTLGLDLGFQAGWRRFSNVDAGETVFDAGADLRMGLVKTSDGAEYDLSAGGGFGVTSGDDLTMLTTAFQLCASRPLYTSAGREITPYAGAVLSIAHTRIDLPDEEDEFSDPDLDIALRLGLSTDISESAAITGELQIREDPAVYLGLSTSF